MTPNEASRLVIGAAMKVHTALGAGVLESACDACLFYELTKAGLHFEHQVHLPIVYEGVQLSTAYRVDFIVENCLILEVKCVERVLPVHRAQLFDPKQTVVSFVPFVSIQRRKALPFREVDTHPAHVPELAITSL